MNKQLMLSFLQMQNASFPNPLRPVDLVESSQDNITAVRVENLSKCYHIYENPRDRFFQMLPFWRKQFFKEFWALTDVSFTVKKGETIGIVGRNGSGKSTLLQLICGILNPTSGHVKTDGRVAALLELGSGFNPEFTGRENVFMNAGLLGLDKHLIDERFDDIANFAGIGDFMYQPVRMYSSGMFVRLAFAVAVNVDPDILIIDEALSVGDIRFQQKCFRKITEFKDRGKSIIFVTHDTGAVINFCDRALWLENGCIAHEGDPDDTVKRYVFYMEHNAKTDDPEISSRVECENLPQASEKIIFGIDNVSSGDQLINISGWAFIPEEGTEDCQKYVVFKSDSDTYVYATSGLERPDVSETYKKLKLNLHNSGFCAHINKSEIRHGQYYLGLYLRKNDVGFFCDTGRKVNLKPDADNNLAAPGKTIHWNDVSGCASFGEGGAEIMGVAFYLKDSFEPVKILKGGENVIFFVDILSKSMITFPGVGLRLNDRYGNHLFSITSYVDKCNIKPLKNGERIMVKMEFNFPKIINGQYTLTTAISDGTQSNHIHHHWVHDAYVIHVSGIGHRYQLGYIVMDPAQIEITNL